MTGFKTIQVMLRTNVNALSSDMVRAGAVVRTFGSQVDDTDRKTAGMGRNITFGKVIAGAAAIAVAGLIAATGASIEFDRNMRNVNSISNLSEGALRSLGGEVIKLSTRLPQSAKELSAGLYDIASSGFQGADGMKVLTASAEAASAGLSTTATAGKAITAVLNAYGMGANEATRVSDALFSTVNLGVITFDELAGSIGDYVGMASAAKVPIEEVGAAIATMTLAGIGASEAGTSLSRVIQAIVDPSDELAAVLKKVGYETGAQALETDGLYKVMNKLREATGGQLTSLLQLFPEIRAARGALALMSAAGQNYTKVFEAMGDQNKNTGATKKALAEQMKGLGMQLDLLKNKAMAWVTTLGMNTIPVVLKLIGALNDPRMKDSQIGKMFSDLVAIGGDVVQILGHLASAAAPVVVALLKLAAVPVVATLRLVASTLEMATGFMADHRGLVIALGAAYLATLVPGMIAAGTQMALLGAAHARIFVGGTIIWVKNMATGFHAAAVAAGGYGKALLGIVAATARIAAVAGILLLADAWIKAGQKADDYIATLKKGFDTSGTLDAYRRNISTLEQEYNKAADAARNHKNETSLLNDIFRGGLSDQLANIKLAKDLRAEHETLKTAFQNTAANYKLIAQEAGISVPAVEAFNTKVGADFTASVESSAAVRKQFIATIAEMAAQAGVTKTELIAMTNDPQIDPARLTAAFEAMEEAGNKTSESFRKATDVVSAFGNETEVTMAKIQKFYEDQIRQANAFAGNVEKALRAGLDPSVIQRALEAGPASAAAFIEAVVQGNVDTNVKILNEGEKSLQSVDQKLRSLAQQNAAAAAGLVDLGATTVTPTVKLNDDELRERLRVGGKQLSEFDKRTPTPKLKADDRDLNEKIRGGTREMERLAGQTPTPKFKADPNDFNLKIQDAHGRLGNLDRSAANPQIRGHNQDLINVANDTHRRMAEVDRIYVAPTVGLVDNASAAAQHIINVLNRIPRNIVTSIRSDTGGIGRHQGGPVLHAGGEVPRFHGGGSPVHNERDIRAQVGEWVIRRGAVRAWESRFGPGAMQSINQGPQATPWANAIPAGGGSMGSPQQLAALVASMKGGGGGDTILNNPVINIRTIWDPKDPMSKKKVFKEIREGLRQQEVSSR